MCDKARSKPDDDDDMREKPVSAKSWKREKEKGQSSSLSSVIPVGPAGLTRARDARLVENIFALALMGRPADRSQKSPASCWVAC